MINPQMILQLLPILQQNPAGVAAQNGLNIQGQNMSDPKAIIQNLMDSEQIDQNTVNMAVNTARQMGYNI